MKIDNIHKILMTNIDRDCKQERSATVRNWILWRLSYPEVYCYCSTVQCSSQHSLTLSKLCTGDRTELSVMQYFVDIVSRCYHIFTYYLANR